MALAVGRHRLVQGSGWSSAEYGTGARAVFAASRCGRVKAVADAVGHEACMADAARAAVQPLLSDLDHALGSTAELVAELRPLLAQINQQLRPTQASASAPSWTHAVSLAMVAYCDSGLVVANMGDTRCYSMRAGKVQSLTRGHGTVAKSIGVPPPAAGDPEVGRAPERGDHRAIHAPVAGRPRRVHPPPQPAPGVET